MSALVDVSAVLGLPLESVSVTTTGVKEPDDVGELTLKLTNVEISAFVPVKVVAAVMLPAAAATLDDDNVTVATPLAFVNAVPDTGDILAYDATALSSVNLTTWLGTIAPVAFFTVAVATTGLPVATVVELSVSVTAPDAPVPVEVPDPELQVTSAHPAPPQPDNAKAHNPAASNPANLPHEFLSHSNFICEPQ